jgi:polypeptide N-acetylgalactosaminyltransferase
VRIIRNAKREGLIHARNRGAQEAKAEVLLFLDSHIECTEGWLEPLLDRIALNSSAIAVPIVNKINDTTFELVPFDHPNYVTLGGFHWDLHFHWFYVNSEFYTNPLAPVITPTMSGGLFAITKKFFMKLGMFDPGLEIWGGENLELSFKAWMCGGKIEIAQCSHVGHVFRMKSPYDWGNSTKTIRRNSMRVAKVWMDEYAVFFNYATGFDKVDYGDISERVKLRNDLKCNSFKWYLKTIYPERTIPDEGISFGEIKNLGFGGKMCLTGNAERQSKDVRVKGCHGRGRDQFWMYNGVIERDNYCLSYVDKKLLTKHCRHSDNQVE